MIGWLFQLLIYGKWRKQGSDVVMGTLSLACLVLENAEFCVETLLQRSLTLKWIDNDTIFIFDLICFPTALFIFAPWFQILFLLPGNSR